MEFSRLFLERRARQEAEVFNYVSSNSTPGVQYLVQRRDGRWYCSCVAGTMGRECRHIRTAMRESGGERRCFCCGKTEYAAHVLHEHHVRRRSTHPELRGDKDNTMLLCPSCHSRATEDHEFEENLKNIWDLKHEAAI